MRASGNVFRDFGRDDADVLQLKAILSRHVSKRDGPVVAPSWSLEQAAHRPAPLLVLGHPMNYAAHLARDPATCGGETVFRGTRVLLRAVLADLADGATIQGILRDFPSLTEEHLRAAIAFAAAAAHDDMPVPPIAGTR